MLRKLCLTAAACLMLGACATGPAVKSGIYHIRPNDTVEIQDRMLDSVNAVRARSGAAPLTLNPQLTAAAQVQARDISRQNRAWPFGSDGSSPYDRIRREGYGGELVGEIYSQSYETELETLAAWMEQPDTRAVILDKRATDVGFAWFQENSGKIWWTLIMGSGRPG